MGFGRQGSAPVVGLQRCSRIEPVSIYRVLYSGYGCQLPLSQHSSKSALCILAFAAKGLLLHVTITTHLSTLHRHPASLKDLSHCPRQYRHLIPSARSHADNHCDTAASAVYQCRPWLCTISCGTVSCTRRISSPKRAFTQANQGRVYTLNEFLLKLS